MTGEYLRGAIDVLDIQPKTLAAEVGLHPATLSRILNNRNDLSERHTSQLLQAIGSIRSRDPKKIEPVALDRR